MVTAISISDCTVKNVSPMLNVVAFYVETPATTLSADTIAITLASYGISATGFMDIKGSVQTTANSVIAREDPTTSVTSGVLTVTVGGTSVTAKRTYLIVGKSA